MTNYDILIAMREMLFYTMLAVSLISVPMLIVGVCFSIIQSATQINEMTITFIPKLIVMFTLLITLSPWLMSKLVQMTQHTLTHLTLYLR